MKKKRLNIEKYKDEIKYYIVSGRNLEVAVCETIKKYNPNGDYSEYGILEWLCEEYQEPILDETERKYLKIVFKSFHKRIKYITKAKDGDGESINYIYDDEHSAWFPPFEKGTMYKNMELRKWYTLEELGITYDD